MIKITLVDGLYKISEDKTYKYGSLVDFGKEENKRIISLGYAEKAPKQTKVRKQPIKKK